MSQRVKGPRWLQVPLVNLPIIGIQFVWSAEAAFVSLYLLELGLSRAHMTLVMIAGPLSGLIVQPIIGALADRSTSKWGRRRPYMLAGSILSALSLIMLSRAQELARWISGSKGDESIGLAQAIAILAVYLIDFTINVGMVASRTLTMDYIIQFLGALGWFPAIFFGTVWMGDIYVHQMRQLKGAEAGSDEALRAEAGRAGSNALFYGAVVTLATSIILPYLVKDLRSQPEDEATSRPRDTAPQSARSSMKPTLTTCWMIAQGLLGLLLLSTSWVETIQGATFLYIAIGYHGGVGNWVPYAIIALAAHKESSQSYIRLDSQQSNGDPDVELEALLEESELTTNSGENQLAGDTPNRIGWFL
ncbi:hypothetical protein FRC07_012560 [Ceratobasidium sp. 392]|nr:hypothetical protein FRC07_012560 [Ceratobasidium sp. 392]